MKKKIKRILQKMWTIFIFGILLVGLTATNTLNVEAITVHSQAEAVEWAMSKVGQSLDYDGVYGAQCVDLIAYYYAYLGTKTPGGNAINYASNALPAGWTRVYGNYQPGDIAVWYANHSCSTCGTGKNGHVAIITSTDASRINVIDQNGPSNKGVCKANSYLTSAIQCAIRPDFSNFGNSDGSIVEVTGVTGITDTTARINARLSSQATVTELGFYLGTSPDNMQRYVENYSGGVITIWYDLGTGKWTPALQRGTTYYYQIYVVIGGVTCKTTLDSFTTNGDVAQPIISNAYITDLSADGYTVVCTATDDIGVARVCFPTWTDANGQDDLVADWYNNATAHSVSGSTYAFRVNISDHNYERGNYTTHIYAFDMSGKSINTAITATVPQPIIYVTNITLSKSALSLKINESSTLTATVEPSNANNKAATWSSSNTSAATVDPYGKVTAVGTGTATITATAQDGSGVSGSCTVTVNQPVTGISLNKSSMTLKVAGTYTLTATVSPSNASNKAVTWSSSNTSVAKVDANGKVTAVAKGTATITATAQDGSGVSKSCKVTVAQPVTKIALNKSSLTLNVKGTSTLTATVSPSNANNKAVTWSSSNTKVATVDANGKVTAVAKGTATITATAQDGSGVSGNCEVTVKQPVTKITLNKSELSIQPTYSYILTATVAPSNANNKAVTWSSSNTKVATVDANGVVTAVAKGTATITATAKDGSGVKGTCKVTVTGTSADKPFPFTDVDPTSWKYAGINYAYQNGFMTGTGATTFNPDGKMTRAQFATTLYSMAGKPSVTYVSKFKDVPNGQWYTLPVMWAYQNGIVSGYSNGNFGVNDNVTREQIALMFYKYVTEVCGRRATGQSGALNSYLDGAKVSSYAKTAMEWAVTNGIMSGKTSSVAGKYNLDPQGDATRAECAAMIRKLNEDFLNR